MDPNASAPPTHAPTPTRRKLLHAAIGVAGATLAAPFASAAPGALRREAFLGAVRAGDLERVKALLVAEPALRGLTDAGGRSSFALARLGGHHAIADFLIAEGHAPDAHEAALALDWERFATLTEHDPDCVNRGHPLGGTPMYCAALGGAGSNIWHVYSAGARPNAVPDASHPPPLQAALLFRDLHVAEITAATLLSNGADANGGPPSQPQPIHIAAARGSADLVEMLIRLGADVGAKDPSGQTALDLARSANHGAAARLLTSHGDIPRTHSTSRTAFDGSGAPYAPPPIDDLPLSQRTRFVGVSHGNLDAVKAQFTAEPRLVHSVATTGEICVEACAHTGRRAVVDFLVERGAPYSLPTAIMSGDKARALELLDADPKRIHERGAHDFALLWYPLIGRCELDMLETLMARGAKVEEQHLLGTTALHWAARSGAIDAAALLVENGASIERVGRKFDPKGETPLQCAVQSKHPKVAELLRSRGAKR